MAEFEAVSSYPRLSGGARARAIWRHAEVDRRCSPGQTGDVKRRRRRRPRDRTCTTSRPESAIGEVGSSGSLLSVVIAIMAAIIAFIKLGPVAAPLALPKAAVNAPVGALDATWTVGPGLGGRFPY